MGHKAKSRTSSLVSKILTIAVMMLVAAFPSLGLALNSDRDKPAEFTAATVWHNQKTGVTVFTGNVKMDQGTTHLLADKLTAYKDSNGQLQKVVAIGNPAHYQTLPEGQEKVIDVKGKLIEYYPPLKKAIVLGEGVVTQGANQFKGTHIEYDIEQQTVISNPSQNNSHNPSVLILEPQNLPETRSTRKRPA